MEQQIKLAAKLYKCRDSMKGLFKEEYPEKIKWYIDVLNNYAHKKEISIFEAVIDICKDPIVGENGMASVLFMAAAVEILEPVGE